MQSAVAPPQTPSPDTVEDPMVTERTFKKVRHAKRSFSEATVHGPGVEGTEFEGSTGEDWFMEDSIIEPDVASPDGELRDGIPVVNLPKDLRLELCRSWKKALIVKYLGKQIGFGVFQHRLLRLWNLQGKHEMIDIGEGFYVVKLELKTDYLHVLTGGPWKILDHYVAVQRWKPEFNPLTEKISTMAVWVRLPGLPVEYFRDDVLKLILEKVGTPLKLDKTTTAVERGRFARVAIEIDLTKPLVSMIWIQNRLQRVEYEALHVVCFGCGSVGHRMADCKDGLREATVSKEQHQKVDTSMEKNTGSTKEVDDAVSIQPTSNNAPPEKYGAWMLVSRKQRPPGKATKEKGGMAGNRRQISNSFEVLREPDQNDGMTDQPEEEAQVEVVPGPIPGKASVPRPMVINSDTVGLQDSSLLLDAPVLFEGDLEAVREGVKKVGNRRGKSKGLGENRVATRPTVNPFRLGDGHHNMFLKKGVSQGFFMFGESSVAGTSDGMVVDDHLVDELGNDATPEGSGCKISSSGLVSQ